MLYQSKEEGLQQNIEYQVLELKSIQTENFASNLRKFSEFVF